MPARTRLVTLEVDGRGTQEPGAVPVVRFGWQRRNPEIRSMRDGQLLIGCGMVGVAYEWSWPPCRATVSVARDGTAHVRSAATDLGTGACTTATQFAAELPGLDLDQVRVEIGDNNLPPAPQSGGLALWPCLES